jgi:hypothetical protein
MSTGPLAGIGYGIIYRQNFVKDLMGNQDIEVYLSK